MRIFVFLAFISVACSALSEDQLQQVMENETLDGIPSVPTSPDDNTINSILLLIWTDLNELSEQVKELNEKTTTLQATTDSLQSQILLVNNKIGKLEDDLEDNTETLNEVKTDLDELKKTAEDSDVSEMAEELEELNEELDEYEENLSELEGVLQYNVTQLSDEDFAMEQDIQEFDNELSELEDLIQFNATQLSNQDIAIEQDVQDMTQQYQQDYAEVNTKISELEQEVEDNYNELKEIVVWLSDGYRYEISQSGAYTWDTARQYCNDRGGDLAYHNLDTIEKRDEIICKKIGWCDDYINDELWWGIHKRQGTTDIWEYMDGTIATDDDIIWVTETQKSADGEDCGMISNQSKPMKAISYHCDYQSYGYFAFCEFEV